MLKRTIKYTDFNGNEQEEEFYFNLSKPEIVEMEVGVEGGLGKLLQSIVDAEDRKELVHYFKIIILAAYGVKSADGKQFIKVDENGRKLSDQFAQSAAYQALFMELAQDDKAAATFMNGVIPADMVQQIDQDKPVGPPPAPPAPPQQIPPAPTQ